MADYERRACGTCRGSGKVVITHPVTGKKESVNCVVCENGWIYTRKDK